MFVRYRAGRFPSLSDRINWPTRTFNFLHHVVVTSRHPSELESSMGKTGLRLHTATGVVCDVIAYQFPESREKFDVFVNGTRTQAALTRGIGRQGDIRHYTYLRLNVKSGYVKVWLDADERVSVP